MKAADYLRIRQADVRREMTSCADRLVRRAQGTVSRTRSPATASHPLRLVAWGLALGALTGLTLGLAGPRLVGAALGTLRAAGRLSRLAVTAGITRGLSD